MTPDTAFTLHPAAHTQAVDLSAIRRTDAILDLLAKRSLMRPRALGDPAILLLRSVAADVDSPSGTAAGGLAGMPAAGLAGSGAPLAGAGAGGRRAGPPASRRGTWMPAAAAAAVIASAAAAVVAAAVGLMVMGALSRLGAVSRGHRYRGHTPPRTGR